MNGAGYKYKYKVFAMQIELHEDTNSILYTGVYQLSPRGAVAHTNRAAVEVTESSVKAPESGNVRSNGLRKMAHDEHLLQVHYSGV